ncbi:MAG TPA: ABC transporter ATP-binding protein, partial [Eubacterium sp.]|nr:ABC transporter ATP-binding protein [Eubacterium sp.]
MNKVIEAKGLCKSFIINKRTTNVLKNIDLSIEEGEMIAIMGPSGSGKSTLLYCVSGMDSVTSGEVLFGERNMAKMKGKELAKMRLDDMGFIFQQMYMMKNLTVLDNIILPAVKSKKKKENRPAIERRGRDLMHRLGIDTIGDNDINEV